MLSVASRMSPVGGIGIGSTRDGAMNLVGKGRGCCRGIGH